MDTGNLTENDVVVFWGGTNDVGKNNSKQGLQNISKFVNKCNHTNVIVMTVSHRHDLISQSCVNKEVSYFNRQLKRRLKPFGNVSVIQEGISTLDMGFISTVVEKKS